MRFLFGFATPFVIKIGSLILGFGFAVGGLEAFVYGDYDVFIGSSLKVSWEMMVRIPQFILQGVMWALSKLGAFVASSAQSLFSAMTPDSPSGGVKATGGFLWDAVLWIKNWVYPQECFR